MGFSGVSDSKESAYIAGDLGPHKSPNISVKWDKRKLSSVTTGRPQFYIEWSQPYFPITSEARMRLKSCGPLAQSTEKANTLFKTCGWMV